MVLYETLYGEDMIDTTLSDQIMIGIGGTCTVRLNNGETMDLVEAGINYNTKVLFGKDLAEINLGFETYQVKSTTFKLEEVTELIVEGFYINRDNRDNVLKLIHEDEITITKIPRRD